MIAGKKGYTEVVWIADQSSEIFFCPFCFLNLLPSQNDSPWAKVEEEGRGHSTFKDRAYISVSQDNKLQKLL